MTTSKRPKRPVAASPKITASVARVLPVVREALVHMKAVDVREIDVRSMTDIADYMIVASGTSDRHVKSIAENVLRFAKNSGVRPFGVEGLRDGEWVLVDLPDVLVHVMLPRVREFYSLEQLWEPPAKAVAQPVAAVARKAKAKTPAKSPRRAVGAPRRGSARARTAGGPARKPGAAARPGARSRPRRDT